jgi:hypothetical protein
MDSGEIIKVMERCLNDPEMIDHLVCEANVCVAAALDGLESNQIITNEVTGFQVKRVLEGMVENTDFSKYT